MSGIDGVPYAFAAAANDALPPTEPGSPTYPEMAAQIRKVNPRKAVTLRINEAVADLIRPVYTRLQDRIRRRVPHAWTKWKHEIEPICRKLEQS